MQARQDNRGSRFLREGAGADPTGARTAIPARADSAVDLTQRTYGRDDSVLTGRHTALRKLSGQIRSMSYNQDVLTEEDKQWIGQRLEKVETTLLTEFHKSASPVELRQKSHAAAIRALDTEVEALSDRLKNLEGR
jgi:hypothetical protein